MLRPGKELQEPLLPRSIKHDSLGTDDDDKVASKKKWQLKSHIVGIAVAVLNCRLFILYVDDRDSKYLIPGEWLVIVLLVLTLFQTNPKVSRTNTSMTIRQGYLVFLGLSLFLPLPLSYIWMACAIPVQGLLLGIELTWLLKEDEQVNSKLIDEDEVMGSPLNSSKTHWGVQCSDCGKLNFLGVRYKAKETLNYDLCETCMKHLAANDAGMYSSFEGMHQPEPLTEEMLAELRAEESRLRKQKLDKKTSLNQEITLLAGNNLNVV